MVIPRGPRRQPPKGLTSKAGIALSNQSIRTGNQREEENVAQMKPTEAEALLAGYVKSTPANEVAPTPQDLPQRNIQGPKKKQRIMNSNQSQQGGSRRNISSEDLDRKRNVAADQHCGPHNRQAEGVNEKSVEMNEEVDQDEQRERKDFPEMSLSKNTSDTSDEVKEDEEQEPDWESIAQDGPARSDAPVFLAARERLKAANSHFAAALDEIHCALKQSIDDLLTTAANIHNVQQDKLDALEAELKQNFIGNHIARAEMQKKLEESAKNAQGLFAQLLMRVSQPVESVTSRLKRTGANDEQLDSAEEENSADNGARI